MKAAISQRSPRPVDTSIWFRSDAVVTPNGYSSYEKFTEGTRKKRIEGLPELFKRLRR
jgi:hypothetical protein